MIPLRPYAQPMCADPFTPPGYHGPSALDADIVRIARTLPVFLRHLHGEARGQAPGGLDLDGSSAFGLWVLQASGPLSAGELARRLRVSPPGVTAMVGRLVAAGLVQSGPDATDRRRTLVQITPAGRAALRTMNRWWRSMLQDVLGRLATDEVTALAGILEHVVAILQDVGPPVLRAPSPGRGSD